MRKRSEKQRKAYNFVLNARAAASAARNFYDAAQNKNQKLNGVKRGVKIKFVFFARLLDYFVAPYYHLFYGKIFVFNSG